MVWEVDHEFMNNNNSDKYHPILGKSMKNPNTL